MPLTSSIPWSIWIILLPLAGGAASFLLGRRQKPWLVVSWAGGILLSAAGLTLQVWEKGAQRYPLGGWAGPLGIELYADGLSALMLIMTGAVGAFISLYALGYFPAGETERERAAASFFWPLWYFLWAALNALFLSGDLFNIYVALEIAGLSAVALVALAGDPWALTAGMRYLLATLLGSLAYLLGVAFLYGFFGVLDIRHLNLLVTPGPAAWAALVLILLGLLLKTALFPFHFWLPSAHAGAPAPVSAALSALVVKASFYLVIRIWFEVFRSASPPEAGFVLGALGGAAILWGSWLALRQKRLKMLVAYSTVAQIGYLFLLFPLVETPLPGETVWNSPPMQGAVYHVFSHAFAKASMFLAAGNILHFLGHDRIADLDGVEQHIPVTFYAFGLSGITLMGLPPSGGFIAKWLMLEAAWKGGHWVLALVLIGGGLLAAAYVFKVYKRAFAAKPMDVQNRPLPFHLEVIPLLLAVVSAALGVFAVPPLALLGR